MICTCGPVAVGGGFLYSQVLQKPTTEQKQQLAVHSKHVAGSVTELVQAAEAMKGEATHAADARCHTVLACTFRRWGYKTFSHR